jgi:hypothetical protein
MVKLGRACNSTWYETTRPWVQIIANTVFKINICGFPKKVKDTHLKFLQDLKKGPPA